MMKAPVRLPITLVSWRFEVDYAMSIAEMFGRGRFNHPNETILSLPHSGRSGHRLYEGKLFAFQSWENPKKNADAIRSEPRHTRHGVDFPWLPAWLEPWLSFAAKYPGVQKRYRIVALGSCRYDGVGTMAPILDSIGGQRRAAERWALELADKSKSLPSLALGVQEVLWA